MIILTFAKQLSPGARRHIRRYKAVLRREHVDTETLKERMARLYAKFGVDKISPPGKKGNKAP